MVWYRRAGPHGSGGGLLPGGGRWHGTGRRHSAGAQRAQPKLRGKRKAGNGGERFRGGVGAQQPRGCSVSCSAGVPAGGHLLKQGLLVARSTALGRGVAKHYILFLHECVCAGPLAKRLFLHLRANAQLAAITFNTNDKHDFTQVTAQLLPKGPFYNFWQPATMALSIL